MTLTKKERTIRAHKELIEKYQNPLGKQFFLDTSCPLCSIHNSGDEDDLIDCRGCPMANRSGSIGCSSHKTYDKAISILHPISMSRKVMIKSTVRLVEKSFNLRAKYHEELIKYLRGLPESLFTKKGWTYLSEPRKIDHRVISSQ